MKRLSLLAFSIFVLVCCIQRAAETQASPQTKPVTETELRTASAKAIKRIQQSQVVWSKRETCASCHHQMLPEIPFKLARERGVSVDEKVAQDIRTATFAYLKDLDGAVQRYDFIDTSSDGWSLVAANAAGVRPNLVTAAFAMSIASHQRPNGSWMTIDGRPPQSYSNVTATAVCAQAVRNYLPEQFADERESRLRLAREWLLAAQPKTTEERAFQLFGLLWTGSDENARANAARPLLASQQADGGWPQLSGWASDAYSTGEALAALRESGGLAVDDPAYQRGIRFLLATQRADGSWRVASRLHPPAPVSPPYFESGFPYGHDQFISIMGTSWAATALLHAIPPTAREATSPPTIAVTEHEDWMRVALTGRASELKALLDAGMSPDAKTSGGTTALMLAARDLEKVKLLVERGADVNARAATGITPLMAAAQHFGGSDVVRVLLKAGARPTVDKGTEVRNDASALYFAVMAGDVRTAGALLDAGAKLETMKVLGRIPISPLLFATVYGDAAMVDCLIGRGANANEVDGDGISALGWATLNNHADTVRALLARGARVNTVDKFGMTPLLYAASIDYGDTAMVEELLAAGADRRARTRRGQTALVLARTYRHGSLASLLAKK